MGRFAFILMWLASTAIASGGGSIGGGGSVSITANRAATSDGTGALTASATTDTELGYVSGVTSAIQTQMNAKLASASFTDAAVSGKLLTGYSSAAGTVAGTDTILVGVNKLNGNIALKAPLAGPTFTGQILTDVALAGTATAPSLALGWANTGIYLPHDRAGGTARDISFSPAGSEVFRVFDGGELGIGVKSYNSPTTYYYNQGFSTDVAETTYSAAMDTVKHTFAGQGIAVSRICDNEGGGANACASWVVTPWNDGSPFVVKHRNDHVSANAGYYMTTDANGLTTLGVSAGNVILKGSGAKPGGALHTDSTAVGNVGGGEDDLITYSLPAATLAATNDHLDIEAFGTFAANANGKEVICYFGATKLFDTGSQLQNAGSWDIKATLIRTGATAQIAAAQLDASATLFPASNTYSTPAETLSGAVTIKCTGQGTADNDIVQKALIVKWYPANT